MWFLAGHRTREGRSTQKRPDAGVVGAPYRGVVSEPEHGPDATIARALADGGPGTGIVVLTPLGAALRWGTTDAVVPVASVTKLAVALAVLVAIEDGSLTLDDPAGPAGSTVRHLLCHASGLAFDDATVPAAPGTRRIYSNTGYDALAARLESSTGLRWETYLTEAVLDPLGMTASIIAGQAGSGLRSSAEDLARLAGELLSPTLVTTATAAEMRQAQFPTLDGVVPGYGQQRPCPWGLGPEIRDSKSPHWMAPTSSPATFGHFGAAGSFMWIDPDAQLAAVYVSSRPFGDWARSSWSDLSAALLLAGSGVHLDDGVL